MRQRLGLAQALLGQPRALLLDEPTTGLDPALRLSFYDILRALRADGADSPAVLARAGRAGERADRVVVMHRGRLMADGTIAELRRLAELPVRMRLRVNGGWPEVEAALPEGTRVARDAGRVDLACPEPRKMEVIRRLAGAGAAVEDMEIVPPSLDELYAHFLREGDR